MAETMVIKLLKVYIPYENGESSRKMCSKLSLSLWEMINFLGGNPCSRNIIEGECVLKAGLVVLVGIRGKKGNFVAILALVLQTSGISKAPLQITGDLQILEDSVVKVKKMVCSCKAGLSEKFKHIGAVLLYLNMHGINELEELFATDVRRLWVGKRKEAVGINYAPKAIKDFCCVKRVTIRSHSSEFIKRAHEMLLQASSDSALKLHRAGRLRETVDKSAEEEQSTNTMSDERMEEMFNDS